MKDQIEIKTQWRINFTKYWDIVRYVENSIENKYREYGKGVLETGEAGFHSSSLRYVSGIIRPANLSDFRSDVKYILNSVPMCSYFDS